MATHLWHVESELLGEVVHHVVCAEDGGRQVEGGLVLRVGRAGRGAVTPAPLVADKKEEEERRRVCHLIRTENGFGWDQKKIADNAHDAKASSLPAFAK